MSKEIFAEIDISEGRKCQVLEINGGHIFRAMALGPINQLSFYLVLECVLLNGKKMESTAEFEKLSGADMLQIMDCINCQITEHV